MNEDTVKWAMAKVLSVWAAVLGAAGITNWKDAASMAAFFYTILLIGEWFWKKWRHKRKCPDEQPTTGY